MEVVRIYVADVGGYRCKIQHLQSGFWSWYISNGINAIKLGMETDTRDEAEYGVSQCTMAPKIRWVEIRPDLSSGTPLGWRQDEDLYVSRLEHLVFFNENCKWTLSYPAGTRRQFDGPQPAMQYATEHPEAPQD